MSGDYISLNAPTAEQSGIVLTEEQKTLYTQDGNSATYINRAEDGRWYDGSGREYVEAGGSWQCVSSGETWMEEIPESTVEEHVEENAEETPEEKRNTGGGAGSSGKCRNRQLTDFPGKCKLKL